MQTYTVVAGDTLGGIAARFSTTPEAIQAANASLVTDINVIQVGWKLTIPDSGALTHPVHPDTAPAATPVEYVVREGDTLGALAAKWGTTVAALVEMNDLADPDMLRVGQVLLRPFSTSDAPVAPHATSQSQASSATTSEPGQLRFTALPLRMPPARINGVFLEQYPNGQHMGYDLGGVPVGTPIFAPAAGKVTVHRPNDGTHFDSFGICVVLDHAGTPYWSIYAHMDGTDLKTGDVVTAGDQIGRLGWTGFVDPPNAGGAHLHWQVSNREFFPKVRENCFDPTSFLSGVTMPGVDDIPAPAGDMNGIDGADLAGPDVPDGGGPKAGFEAPGN